MKKSGYITASLPLLKWLRESQSLSQRALAKKSGVAHDTIGQIERGDRLARPSTTRKLAEALNVTPFILASSLEDLASLTEGQLADIIEEELGDIDTELQTMQAIDEVRKFLVTLGYAQAAAQWEEMKAAASYSDILEEIAQAHKKLNDGQADSVIGELLEMAEAALLLVRASAQLLYFVSGALEPRDYDRFRSTPELGELGKLAWPLADAWLEGAAATKGLLHIRNRVIHELGELSLGIEGSHTGRYEQVLPGGSKPGEAPVWRYVPPAEEGGDQEASVSKAEKGEE